MDKCNAKRGNSYKTSSKNHVNVVRIEILIQRKNYENAKGKNIITFLEVGIIKLSLISE